MLRLKWKLSIELELSWDPYGSQGPIAVLLEAGLARVQTSFGILIFTFSSNLNNLRQKLKIWENYVEGEEVSHGAAAENKHNRKKCSSEVVNSMYRLLVIKR
ncbi:ribonuclease TUDOR 1-like [Prosopis cineraria]|uniref:ribonuclease TUDOR 1-like n=1 Tax=Prosopis cineraria TaxID=364024 RepID=UPI00240F2E34|nr:ribonuclease TUDOR 1-like [Prosopis cineraria]